MKKVILTALASILLLAACINENKKESDDHIANNASKKELEAKMEPPLPPPPPVDDEIVNFMSMDSPPTYPGGMPTFYKFIGDNLQYPSIARENKVEGSVLISFVIEKDGTLTNVNVDRELGSGTDDEAIRVLKMSKKWSPGMVDGKPVRVKYNIPIKFTLK